MLLAFQNIFAYQKQTKTFMKNVSYKKKLIEYFLNTLYLLKKSMVVYWTIRVLYGTVHTVLYQNTYIRYVM
jgi:hypothetical protein